MLYLWVAGMKAPLWHIKWITSGTHHASEQVGLPLHTTNRGQVSVNNMAVEDTVERSCCLTCPWLRPFISFVRKSQLFLEIPRSTLPALSVASTAWGGPSCKHTPTNLDKVLVLRQGSGGCRFLYKLDSAGFEKVDIKLHKPRRVFVACLIIH